jgi:hypothetical protein
MCTVNVPETLTETAIPCHTVGMKTAITGRKKQINREKASWKKEKMRG